MKILKCNIDKFELFVNKSNPTVRESQSYCGFSYVKR